VSLFDLEEDAPNASVELTVALTAEEYERLRARARTRGVSPEQVLRDLI
jgi:ribonuclease HI